MVLRMAVREARSRFADVLGRVHYSGEAVIIERFGQPIVAVIPVETYQQLMAERDARFEALEALRQRLPEIPQEEVARDVSEAIAAIRKAESTGV